MEPNEAPPRTYYRARDELQINNLPFFFGWVDFEGDKVVGEHYKPKIDRPSGAYLIGYYKIEGEAANFAQTFAKHGLVEITQEEFNVILSQWTRGGEYAPNQWGLAWTWEIAGSA
ncbi:MAG: hypothetical protein JW953_20155 [Anaerolineae bacterium]|nr:hypothetical protein [Anaerolineae bacterium]